MDDRRTPLDDLHRAAGATMTSFAGWSLPVRFTSELAEHHAVRTAAGIFDLSHMGQLIVTGPQAGVGLDYALTSTLSNLAVGRARYTMAVNNDGGVLDDLVVYRTGVDRFEVVCNAANAATVETVLNERLAAVDALVAVASHRSLLAVQGPQAVTILADLITNDAVITPMRPFSCADVELAGYPCLLARTGYTGEDGFEVFVEAGQAPALWQAVERAGAGKGLLACGLAARDTLRLEAAMPLYGHELDETTTPFEAGWGRVVDLTKPEDWVGRAALSEASTAPARRTLIGLAGRGRRAARQGNSVVAPGGAVVGQVTSGVLSPTLGHPIAMAYVAPGLVHEGDELTVDVRGTPMPMDVVALPFYRRPRPAAG